MSQGWGEQSRQFRVVLDRAPGHVEFPCDGAHKTGVIVFDHPAAEVPNVPVGFVAEVDPALEFLPYEVRAGFLCSYQHAITN